MLHVPLDRGVVEIPTDQTLGVKDVVAANAEDVLGKQPENNSKIENLEFCLRSSIKYYLASWALDLSPIQKIATLSKLGFSSNSLRMPLQMLEWIALKRP